MIPQETVAEIFEKAIIEDVVGDYVSLKKRGSNMLGLCPFHNEKTPSFNVSPAKGIYKCFGCGKGGNSVNFIMEHEHYTYPEALKHLAKKYNIEIEEREQTPEEIQKANARESLFIVTEFADSFFREQLKNGEEGRAVGLSYFKERGFNEQTIKEFGLGYCPKGPDGSMTSAALRKGYKKQFLLETGLSKDGQYGEYDFYRGRVIFPIRNLSGRTIGFGARILTNDKKTAKYFNSPESAIYSKSKVLYGLFESKNDIIREDMCLLVEGYTDVISLHQAGVKNVVSSSGTSLTTGQIKMIQRYTPNITIIYDSDAAGIKASFRGIDMLLEEGMKIRVVALPEGDDPDSLAQRLSLEGLKEFIKEHSQDFFDFKSDILLKDAARDPILKTKAIHEIADSLALLPDAIEFNLRSNLASQRLGIDQQTLLNEVNRAKKRLNDKRVERLRRESNRPPFPPQNTGFSPDPSFSAEAPPPMTEHPSAPAGMRDAGFGPPPPGVEQAPPVAHDQPLPEHSPLIHNPSREQEEDILRILLKYGELPITIQVLDEEDKEVDEETIIETYVMEELVDNRLNFHEPVHKLVFGIYQSNFIAERTTPSKMLLQHPDMSISQFCANLLSEEHMLHDWERHDVEVTGEDKKRNYMVESALNRLKLITILTQIKETETEMKLPGLEATRSDALQRKKMQLDKVKIELAEYFGNAII